MSVTTTHQNQNPATRHWISANEGQQALEDGEADSGNPGVASVSGFNRVCRLSCGEGDRRGAPQAPRVEGPKLSIGETEAM